MVVRGGGAIFAKKIIIQDNSKDVAFSDNSMNIQDNDIQKSNILGGGALFGMDEVHICNNANLIFSNNYVCGETGSGGAILSQAIDLSKNQGMEFLRNTSLNLGGAVCALHGALNVSDNAHDVSFISNKTKIAGGALASAEGHIFLHRNQGSVEFKNNGMLRPSENGDSYSGGGAIFAKQGVDIRENIQSISFQEIVQEILEGRF